MVMWVSGIRARRSFAEPFVASEVEHFLELGSLSSWQGGWKAPSALRDFSHVGHASSTCHLESHGIATGIMVSLSHLLIEDLDQLFTPSQPVYEPACNVSVLSCPVQWHPAFFSWNKLRVSPLLLFGGMFGLQLSGNRGCSKWPHKS